jgi:predicted glycosyltransferase
MIKSLFKKGGFWKFLVYPEASSMVYSSTLDKSRLDILIYSHDGRGLGHVSRGVTLGMSLRRLFPELRVLFLSGFRQTAMLIGSCPLEWIKLPSYETSIIDGSPRGRRGDINIKNCYLGPARANIIESIIFNFKPRCILVDHEPRGKREELLPSLRLTKGTDTIWILGIRAVVGKVATIWSELSKNTFKDYYHSLLWYGDKRILGDEIPQAIGQYFDTKPISTGYVSRFLELRHWASYTSERFAGTIAVPWLSELSVRLLGNLHGALLEVGDHHGRWVIFTDLNRLEAEDQKIKLKFDDLSACKLENISDQYLASLANSKVAMIYGGYNSLTDIMAAGVPTVVIVREMNEKEQDEHVSNIIKAKPNLIYPMRESEVTQKKLVEALERQLSAEIEEDQEILLKGSEVSARKIVELLEYSH